MPAAEQPTSGSDVRASAVAAMRRYMETMPQSLSCSEELKSTKFWKQLRAEMVCTLTACVLIGGSAASFCSVPATAAVSEVVSGNATVADRLPTAPTCSSNLCRDIAIVLAQFCVVATLTQCFGNVSGAHMNPALTCGMLIVSYISPLRALGYVTAQLVGSMSAAAVLYALQNAATQPANCRAMIGVSEGVLPTQAFGVECLATFVLVVAHLAALDTSRLDVGCKAVSIGLAYAAAAIFSVYWAGPLSGGVLGSLTYEFTHETAAEGATIKRSFRRRPPPLPNPHAPSSSRHLHACSRDVSCLSQLTISTSQPIGTEDLNISGLQT